MGSKGRAPCGARGLKRVQRRHIFGTVMSRPVWGAWIETISQGAIPGSIWSRPVWGAWIETLPALRDRRRQRVAPRVGRVD